MYVATHIAFSTFGLGLLTGAVVVTGIRGLWKNTFGEIGHAVYGCADEYVRDALAGVLKKHLGLSVRMKIDVGGSHQRVLSDGITVPTCFDRPIRDNWHEPVNVRSFVVNSAKRRTLAAEALVRELRLLGKHAEITEPLHEVMPGTFLLVRSPESFLGRSAIAFRPCGILMLLSMARKSRTVR